MNGNLVDEVVVILIWVSLWGISENLISKYIPAENYNVRILIFLALLVISLFLYFSRKK
ncbi:putative ORFan [Tupanvirus deep ocean]|uniref:ORFan n=2 Tax=Tupanvirus TaxID=2094720 RepID=A0AC62A9N0_9VIRU|nr:putative ORFan [Tupanvirus deep ocean]QKU34486.1 putative ORFan [Tupanvirus deep ocean]